MKIDKKIINLNDKKRIFLNSIILTISTVIEKLLFFVINVLVARYLTKENYGIYTTALGYATFFANMTNIGINQTLVRQLNLDSKNEKYHMGNAILFKTILACLVYLIMIVSLYFTNYNELTVLLIIISGIFRLGNEYHRVFYAIYDAKEKFFVVSVINTFFSILLLLGTLGVIFFKGSVVTLMNVRLIVVFIILVLLIYITFKNYRIKINLSLIKEFIVKATPFALTSILYNTISTTNIIILSLIHGTMLSGIFNNAYLFLTSLLFIPVNFTRILVPFLYKTSIDEDKNKYQFAFDIFSKYSGIASIYLMAIFFIFARDIILLIYGTKYEDSIIILKIVSFAIPFFFNIGTTIITALDKQFFNTIIYAISAVVNVIINIILIYFWGAAGAACAVIITYFLMFFLPLLYLNNQKFLKMGNTLKVYLKLIIIFIILVEVDFYMPDINWFIQAFILSVLFFLLVIALMIRRDDLRIIRETLGNK